MIRKLLGIFKREEKQMEPEWSEESGEMLPPYSIGEPVIIVNPYMQEDEPPVHGTVTKIAFVEDERLFLFQIDGRPEWINENWLHYDIYGPKVLQVREVSALKLVNDQKGRKLEIDYWLQSLAYEKSKGNEEGVRQAVKEINRLRGVNDGK